jgi:hypothetical protein
VIRAGAIALALLCGGAAEAQFLGPNGGVDSLPSGNRPVFSFVAPAAGAYSTLTAATGQTLPCSRASTATYLDGSGTRQTAASNTCRVENTGLLMEGASTNRLLNSTAPATQTTASLATGSYTGWIEGSGSVAFTVGTATATGLPCTATTGVANDCHFSITGAGTIVATKTGTVTAEQLEQMPFRTSLIITAGTVATRAADVGPATTSVSFSASGGVFRVTGWTPAWSSASTTPAAILCIGNNGFMYYNAAGTIRFGTVSQAVDATGLSWSANTSHTIVGRWDATKVYLSVDGAAEVSRSAATATPNRVGVLENESCGTGDAFAHVVSVKACRGSIASRCP